MWNKSFHKYLELEESKSHRIKDCTVVIDAQSYFYHMYEKSGLHYVYGCESDKYARYLERNLEMFFKTNIKCYFLFKGSQPQAIFKTKYHKDKDFIPEFDTVSRNTVVNPVFYKDIHKQVLEKMKFQYSNCEFETCTEVIALARKIKCPIIGNNHIIYCASGVEYISVDSLSLEKKGNAIKCSLISLKNLLQKYRLTPEKLALFITITHDSEYDSEYKKELYLRLFPKLNMPKKEYSRNICLLKWLGQVSVAKALDTIYKYVNREYFRKHLEKTKSYMSNHIMPGIPSRYLENNDFKITEVDPHWLEKGVAAGYIISQYAQLYHYGVFFCAWTIHDTTANDSLLLSIKIISYVYNLLTNYKKQDYILIDRKKKEHTISLTQQNGNVSNPVNNAVESPFENGWDQIKNLRLFEHFLEESLHGFNHTALQDAPEDARLLIIALVYFSRQKTKDTTNIVCSVLLSYIMLGIVFDNLPETDRNNTDQNKLYLDNVIEKASITQKDCVLANDALKRYFELTPTECKAIFNAQLLHPLVEFQHILQHLNLLNKLCGSPFMPTEYSKTFNGTFAYKFIFEAEFLESPNGLDLVNECLGSADTVLYFFSSLLDIYHKMMTP